MPYKGITLPTYWATYLFYGSTDGLDQNEIQTIDQVLAHYGVARASVASMDECGFMVYHDAEQFGVLACEVATYSFHA
jgi:hypothetical protein